MTDETWGAIAWWSATIFKWAFWAVIAYVVLQLVYIFALGGHRPFWMEFRPN